MNQIAKPVVRTAAALVAVFGAFAQTACDRPESKSHFTPLSACAPGLLSCDPNDPKQNVRAGDTLPAWWLHSGFDVTANGQVVRGNTGAEGTAYGGSVVNGAISNGLGAWSILRQKPDTTDISVNAVQGQQTTQTQTAQQQAAATAAANAAAQAAARSRSSSNPVAEVIQPILPPPQKDKSKPNGCNC